MQNAEKLLMTTDAARLLNRSAEAVRSYERNGKLAATKTANGHRLVREQDVRKFASRPMEKPSIIEIIGARVELRKLGWEDKGLCPFHEEKTASFSVNEEKGVFYCHGCQAGGDVIDFIMQLDGVSFREAAKSLGIEGTPVSRAPVRPEAVEIAAWSNEQTQRANALLREIGHRLQLAKELGWREESAILRREWVILKDLAEDLQSLKLIIELYQNRYEIEELLADADIDHLPPEFAQLTSEYRERLARLTEGDA